jgi:hypothetical protein
MKRCIIITQVSPESSAKIQTFELSKETREIEQNA